MSRIETEEDEGEKGEDDSRKERRGYNGVQALWGKVGDEDPLGQILWREVFVHQGKL